jgi:hypothetical protein
MLSKPSLRPMYVRHLKAEFVDDPQQMIYEFCEQFEFTDSRTMLWRMTMAFFGAEECNGLDRHERSQYLFFYQQLEALFEAIHLLNEDDAHGRRP